MIHSSGKFIRFNRTKMRQNSASGNKSDNLNFGDRVEKGNAICPLICQLQNAKAPRSHANGIKSSCKPHPIGFARRIYVWYVCIFVYHVCDACGYAQSSVENPPFEQLPRNARTIFWFIPRFIISNSSHFFRCHGSNGFADVKYDTRLKIEFVNISVGYLGELKNL